MKTGKSLVELAQELTRIRDAKRDFVVPTERLRAEVVDSHTNEPPRGLDVNVVEPPKKVVLAFENGDAHRYSLNSWSKGQLAQYADIPKAYMERLITERPELAANNINHGLERVAKQSRKSGAPESRLVRTLDGNVRGLLSSRYRILDAHDMLEAVFPVIADRGMNVASSEVTERRLFIKALSPKLQTEVKKGDVVQYGLVVSTSDVGAGSVRVEPLIFRLACLNGMISTTAIRRFHVGKNQAEDDVRELLSDRTRELTDAAFWAQVRDVVIGSMKPENFEREVDKLRLAANLEIKNFDLPRVVELTMKAVNITGEEKKNSILAALANGNEGAGLTQWGLINSFTRAAKADELSYEESIEMERAAGQILELPRKSWEHISAKAS